MQDQKHKRWRVGERGGNQGSFDLECQTLLLLIMKVHRRSEVGTDSIVHSESTDRIVMRPNR